MREEPGRSTQNVSCPCGADVRVDPHSPERRVTCPKCGMSLDFVVSMDRRLKKPMVSIVVPLESMKAEGQSLALSRARPAVTRAPAPSRPSPAARAPAPPPRKTMRGVLATCACGASFPVNEEELTSIQTCPQCKTVYHVVVKMDPDRRKSAILVPKKPVARSADKLRTIAPPKPPPSATRTAKRTNVGPLPSDTRKHPAVRKVRAPAPEVPPGAQAVPCPCGGILIVRKKDLERGLTCPSCGEARRFQEVCDPQSLAPMIRIRPEPRK